MKLLFKEKNPLFGIFSLSLQKAMYIKNSSQLKNKKSNWMQSLIKLYNYTKALKYSAVRSNNCNAKLS